MKNTVKIIIVLAIIGIPATILLVNYGQAQGLVPGKPLIPTGVVEDQTIFIESHGPIMEPVTGADGVVRYRQIEDAFWPFYAADGDPSTANDDTILLGPTKQIYVCKEPGVFYSGSTTFEVKSITDTEANIMALFKVDSLYLLNGSAKVFYSKDPFDTRGTYTFLFKIEGTWYFNSRGTTIHLDEGNSFLTLEGLLSNIVIQVNNGFTDIPR